MVLYLIAASIFSGAGGLAAYALTKDLGEAIDHLHRWQLPAVWDEWADHDKETVQ